MFDHRVVPLPLGESDELDLIELEQILKNEGEKGWELVTILPRQNLTSSGLAHLVLFKRPRTRNVFHR